ncbi:DUF3310 domain-containing protein [Streptomyces sp. NPDC053048]|uniref:DUF3310 domain-containing protein n=1 Tax=Streptomyces sp. NPDC053048 TaxID=3365694 RepID=UPI0037CFB4D9
MKYKFGDKVRVAASYRYAGCTGYVYAVNSYTTAPYPYGVLLNIDGTSKGMGFGEDELEPDASLTVGDSVSQPSHYTWLPNGVEVIDLTEHLNFNRGNAVKYIARAGKKDPSAELEDLRKARWYVNREIERIERGAKHA